MVEGKCFFGNYYFNIGGGVYLCYMSWFGKVIGLIECINGCLQCLMNGRLLLKDLLQMCVMFDYMVWLSSFVLVGVKVVVFSEGFIDSMLILDLNCGQVLYVVQCVVCYGDNGEGWCDVSGDIVFLLLWGDYSFNIGVGMVCLYKVVGFVKYNMLLVVICELLLGQQVMFDQDVVDIVSYFINQLWLDFVNKGKDWLCDLKFKDVCY